VLSAFRVLVVEDFEPFRKHVRSALGATREYRIVGEAADGVDAVRKAGDLQPDLILLDVGLPRLSGLAAASQIRLAAPDSRLLFLSLESSHDVVREAFRVGAHGYVHKLSAHLDLLPAVRAVLAGKQFVSPDINFTDGPRPYRRHDMQIYSDDDVFLDGAARFIANALDCDGAVILVLTESHRGQLIERLRSDGLDVNQAIKRGTLCWLDVDEVFSRAIVDGAPDLNRLAVTLAGLVESSRAATQKIDPRVSLVGECAPTLWARGDKRAALELERKATEFVHALDLDILCMYSEDMLALQDICAEHTAVFHAA
jgi:DNA-binding response OmpR family regulator